MGKLIRQGKQLSLKDDAIAAEATRYEAAELRDLVGAFLQR